MQIQLGQWHPVASHLAALTLGIALTHLTERPEAMVRLAPGDLAVSLSSAWFSPQGFPKTPSLRDVLLQTTPDQRCRLFSKPIKVTGDKNSATIFTSLNQMEAVASIPKMLKQNRKATLLLSKDANVSPCSKPQSERIIYGG